MEPGILKVARKDDPAELSGLLTSTLKARGDTLGAQLTSARKKLPKKLAREADAIVAAEKRARYRPDLPPIEEARLRKARSAISGHVRKLDPKGDRKRARAQWLSSLALNLLLACVAIGAFYWIGSQTR